MAISIKESIALGLIDFWSRKVRSFVSLLGVILGAMSIIVIMALTNGINKYSQEAILSNGGIDKISVYKDWRYESKKKEVKEYFTLSEINFIKSELPEDVLFNPLIQNWGRIDVNSKSTWGSITGTLAEYSEVSEWDVAKGRFISDFDYMNASSVIVLGHNAAKNLFERKNPIGKIVNYKGKRLKVIGVMDYKYLKSMGGNFNQGDNSLDYMNNWSFVPLSTMSKKIEKTQIRSFSIKVIDVADVPKITKQVEQILLNLRQREPIFKVESNLDELSETASGMKIFKVVFGVISFISLLVAGIVIMNIMLSTVNERTREIGVRLATGARRRDIFIQFLVQTVITTTIGGIAGAGLGYSLLGFIKNYLDAPMIMDIHIALTGILISSVVGLFFGIMPAIRASNMDPVKALRYE